MIPAWSLERVLDDLRVRFERDGFDTDAVKMVGLLFARPQVPLVREQIVPNLPYFHERSGRHIHFFCVGWGEGWTRDDVPDPESIQIDGTTWVYSDRNFNEFRRRLAKFTQGRWRYSGGTDLVLTNSVWWAENHVATLDFSSSLSMNLERAIEDGAIEDVGRWFEQIFQFAETNTANDPAWGFGLTAGLASATSGLVSGILSLLPGRFDSEAKKARHFLVADLAAAPEQ